MEETREKHIVMFPFMAQGHIIPFLALALQIEQKKNYAITIVNTPLNIKKIRSTLPQNSSIVLQQLPFFPSDHGLPPEAENTDTLPYPLIIRLINACFSFSHSFEQLIHDLSRGNRDLCIISDMFLGWTVDVAQKFGTFHVIFSGPGGFGLGCYYSVWIHKPHKKIAAESYEFSLPDFPEAGKFHMTQLATNMLEPDETDPWSEFQAKNIPKWLESDGMLFNTIEELDFTGLTFFRRIIGKPIWPIGPLTLSNAGKDLSELYKQWLDHKPVNSVLYISFGSNNTVSASQMMQLAIALEKSGKNFIWVIRPPLGFDVKSEFKAEEWLPEGFTERIENRGLIVQTWAPQVEILSHGSVGAFLSHCGWNSVLEALSHGVLVIGWPLAAEQFFNCKFLEENVGVCVEVARGTNFEVRHEDVMEKIDMVIGGKEIEKEMRRKVCKVRDMIMSATKDEQGFKGSSVKAMDEFLDVALLSKGRTRENNGLL